MTSSTRLLTLAAGILVITLGGCGDRPRADSGTAPDWVRTGQPPEGGATPSGQTAPTGPATVTAKEPPAWVRTPPQQAGMLFGVAGSPRGQGARESAEQKARKEVAAQIEISLKAETRTHEVVTETSYGGKRTESLVAEYQQTIETKVAQEELPGVTVREVVDTPQDTWVLVAFDRSAWAAQLRTRIADVDQKMVAVREDVKRESADGRGGVGALARASKRLFPLAAERTSLVRRLRLADATGELPKAGVDIDRFKSDLAKHLDAVTIALTSPGTVGGDNEALLIARITGALNRIGLSVVAPGEKALLTTGLVARFQEIPVEAERRRINLSLAATFTGATGRPAGTIEVKGAGLASPSVARDKAIDDAAQKLVEQLDLQFIDILSRF